MNTFLKSLSDFFASLTSAEQAYERSYPAHEIELFLLKLNDVFDLNINVAQAMELVNSLKPGQSANTTLNVEFCDCRHTVGLDCVRQHDGITMRFKSASMPLNYAINAELKKFEPSLSTMDNIELVRAA